MSQETEQARADFVQARQDAENVLWFSATTQHGPGRRHRHPSLHRAAIVLTTAAWQAFVQDVTSAILANLEVPIGDPGRPMFDLIKASTRSSIGRFNTPNSRNSLALFANVGFDPTAQWRFSMTGPSRTYDRQRVRQEVDGWLDIRHKIAHGAPLPANEFVSGRSQRGPSLHRKDAERCVWFFSAVVELTSNAAGQQFP
jgi:hypothetical protein